MPLALARGMTTLQPVTEILFYHLQNQPLEAVLPNLLERSLERQWRATIQAASEEQLQALDDQPWTYSDDSFLPHGTDRDADAASQPVVLTLKAVNPNRKVNVDTRTPDDLLNLIEAKGREIGEALAVLRQRRAPAT